jgi:hypothetical protein
LLFKYYSWLGLECRSIYVRLEELASPTLSRVYDRDTWKLLSTSMKIYPLILIPLSKASELIARVVSILSYSLVNYPHFKLIFEALTMKFDEGSISRSSNISILSYSGGFIVLPPRP